MILNKNNNNNNRGVFLELLVAAKKKHIVRAGGDMKALVLLYRANKIMSREF